MGRHFDMAYAHALTKIAAFDVDDEEDRRLYDKIKNDPRTNSWIQGTHDDLKGTRNSLRNFALGAGAVGLGSGIIGAASKKARPIAVPVAVGTGLLGALSGIGALGAHGNMKDYDNDVSGVRRRMNIDRYLERHGSQYAGRRSQREEDDRRVRNALGTLLIADAISSR